MTTTPPDTAQPGPDTAIGHWRRQVELVLARSGAHPDAPVDEPERVLDTRTYDDLVVKALYTAADALPEQPLPGHSPYTRGSLPPSRAPGWDVRARHVLGLDAVDTNHAVLTDLENGVTSLWLSFPAQALPPVTLDQVLSGVRLDVAPVALEAGPRFVQVAQDFFALIDAQTDVDPALVNISLGADPLSLLLREGTVTEGAGLADAVQLAALVRDRPGRATTFVADGTSAHEAGASDVEELAVTLAAAVTYLRAQVAAGIDPGVALGQIEFRHCLGDDQFQGIAKLRAARRLWARVAQVAGAGEGVSGARQHAVTSAAMLSQRDPWVNVLRCTLATFAAATGGAQSVTVLPFDEAIPGGAPGVSRAFSARLARNCQIVLLEEAHVGQVLDPVGGSWYVESLTDALAHAAWDWFREIEAAGGFQAAVPLITERIAATRQRRLADVAHRRRPLTGVNEFPDLAQAPLPATARASVAGPAIRYGAAYESLRDRSDDHLERVGVRPTAVLCMLAGGSGRASFAANLLASGGVATVRFGPYATAADVPGAELCAQAPLVVLCGSDQAYATEAAATVASLRGAGVALLAITGAWAGSLALRPDAVLADGIDAVSVLSGLLDSMGVR